jgi:CheY-like chemotaxis protein
MARVETPGYLPPRVLLIIPDQWPRALLRAALRDAGYDALGAPSPGAGLRYRAQAEGRGPVGLIVVDQAAVRGDEAADRLAALRRRHGHPPVVLLASTTAPGMPGDATQGVVRRVRRPVSIADLVAAVRSALPMASGPDRPLDG